MTINDTLHPPIPAASKSVGLRGYFSALAFRPKNGQPQCQIKKTAELAGIPQICSHLRPNFATRLLRAGVRIVTIQKRRGPPSDYNYTSLLPFRL